MHLHPFEADPSATGDLLDRRGSPLGVGFYRRFAKRALDIVLVLPAIIPILMVLLPMCALIAMDGHSPLYRQARIGRNGRVFRMWKLRSMVHDAEGRLQEYLAANPGARAEWDYSQKLRNDPRITWIGAFIRKTSLDELPQLFNVLKGDMSLVGPRPIMADQRAIYPGTAYYALRPGITGIWQTSARNESSFSERAIFDARYYREMSFSTDVQLIAKTFRVVVKGTGF